MSKSGAMERMDALICEGHEYFCAEWMSARGYQCVCGRGRVIALREENARLREEKDALHAKLEEARELIVDHLIEPGMLCSECEQSVDAHKKGCRLAAVMED